MNCRSICKRLGPRCSNAQHIHAMNVIVSVRTLQCTFERTSSAAARSPGHHARGMNLEYTVLSTLPVPVMMATVYRGFYPGNHFVAWKLETEESVTQRGEAPKVLRTRRTSRQGGWSMGGRVPFPYDCRGSWR